MQDPTQQPPEPATPESNFVQVALVIGAVTNQLGGAYSVLTRLPNMFSEKGAQYTEAVANMRKYLQETKAGDPDLAQMIAGVDGIEKILNLVLAVKIDVAALDTVKALLEEQQSQIQAMIKDQAESDPGVS